MGGHCWWKKALIWKQCSYKTCCTTVGVTPALPWHINKYIYKTFSTYTHNTSQRKFRPIVWGLLKGIQCRQSLSEVEVEEAGEGKKGTPWKEITAFHHKRTPKRHQSSQKWWWCHPKTKLRHSEWRINFSDFMTAPVDFLQQYVPMDIIITARRHMKLKLMDYLRDI